MELSAPHPVLALQGESQERPPHIELGILDKLIGALYACALDEAAQTDALDELTVLLQARASRIHVVDASNGEVIGSSVYSRSCDAQLRGEFAQPRAVEDPRVAIVRNLRPGQVARCHQWLNDDSVSASHFYQEFLIPAGYRWTLFGMVHFDNGAAMLVEVLRGPDNPPFEGWTESFMSALLPHWRRAEALRSRYLRARAGHADIHAVVEHLPLPACVLDDCGRVLVRNAAADGVLSEFPAYLRGSYLRFHSRQVHERWMEAFCQSRRRGKPESLWIQPDARVCWALHLVPWKLLAPQVESAIGSLMLLMLERRGPPTASQIEQFAAAGGLTKAEAEVLAYLLDGCSTKQIARERGSSPNTIKSQLRSILEKAECRSQRELMSRFHELMSRFQLLVHGTDSVVRPGLHRARSQETAEPGTDCIGVWSGQAPMPGPALPRPCSPGRASHTN